MSLIAAKDITEPKIKVSPPGWLLALFYLMPVVLLVVIDNLPIEHLLIKYVAALMICLVGIAIARKQLKGNFLVTLQANKSGLYFQTDDVNRYFYVPWQDIGLMEKAVFPVNKRGLRIEITGESLARLKDSDHVGNVFAKNDRTFIYTIPQLHDRDKLIKRFAELKSHCIQ